MSSARRSYTQSCANIQIRGQEHDVGKRNLITVQEGKQRQGIASTLRPYHRKKLSIGLAKD